MNFEPLNVSIDLINDKVGFTGAAANNTPISIDYTPPIGDGLGYTSLELLLLSLASCMGTSMLLLLRGKQHRTITGCRIQAHGTRRAEHPTCFEHIEVELEFHSPDATDMDVQHALRITESTLCPVWAMIKASVEVYPTYQIIRTTETPPPVI